MKKVLTYFLLAGVLFTACKKEAPPPRTTAPVNSLVSGWTVPINQLVLSQHPPDRIPSIDNPNFEPLDDHNLGPDETVYLYRHGNTVKVYPQNILWHHEIVNDQIDDQYFAVSFCPLTGSGVAWNRKIGGTVSEFGVSGHLFNENLIPFDRNTKSFWSQMLLQGIKGSFADDGLESEFLLTTTGSTIISSFPDALVLVDTSRHECDSVCRELKSGNELTGDDYFGLVDIGRIKDPEALLFNYDDFDDQIMIYQTHFNSSKIIVAGSKALQFIVAFTDNTGDALIQFYPVQNELPVIMEDNRSNRYDLTGLAVSGMNKGTRLPSPDAYFAHRFAWDSFFGNNVQVYEVGRD